MATLYRDIRTGKYAKYDGRKKKYLRKVKQTNLPKSHTQETQSTKEKIETIRERFGDTGRRKSSRDEKFARLGFKEKIEIPRTGNEDLFNYFGKKQLNKKIAEFEKNKPSDKHVVVATVEIKSNIKGAGTIVTREVNLSANDLRFLEGSRRKGRKYDYKDVLTRHIHQVLDERSLTPYTGGVSDGRKAKKRKGGSRLKKFGSKQVYTIRLRYAGPRSKRDADNYQQLREEAD